MNTALPPDEIERIRADQERANREHFERSRAEYAGSEQERRDNEQIQRSKPARGAANGTAVAMMEDCPITPVGLDCLEVEPPPAEFIIPGYLPVELILRSAPGGLGKSTLAVQEAISMVTGAPLFGLEGFTIERPGSVVIVTAEYLSGCAVCAEAWSGIPRGRYCAAPLTGGPPR